MGCLGLSAHPELWQSTQSHGAQVTYVRAAGAMGVSWAMGLLKTRWTRALSWSGIDVVFLGKGFE